MSSRFRTHLAARIIHQGGVVAYPTEAVYGLGCDPLDAYAVARLLKLKQRPESKGLILIASHVEQLDPFVDDLEQWLPKIGNEWPGAHTFLLPAANDLPRWVNGGNNKIAFRVTTHPIASALCEETGHAIVSTSANRSGQAPAKSAFEVQQRCPGCDYVLSGALGQLDKPTPITDITTGKRLR